MKKRHEATAVIRIGPAEHHGFVRSDITTEGSPEGPGPHATNDDADSPCPQHRTKVRIPPTKRPRLGRKCITAMITLADFRRVGRVVAMTSDGQWLSLRSQANCQERMSADHPKQTSGGQRRIRATAAKFFAGTTGKPFQEASSALRQGHEPTVPHQRSSVDADINRPQDRSVHRAV